MKKLTFLILILAALSASAQKVGILTVSGVEIIGQYVSADSAHVVTDKGMVPWRQVKKVALMPDSGEAKMMLLFWAKKNEYVRRAYAPASFLPRLAIPETPEEKLSQALTPVVYKDKRFYQIRFAKLLQTGGWLAILAPVVSTIGVLTYYSSDLKDPTPVQVGFIISGALTFGSFGCLAGAGSVYKRKLID